MKLPTRPDMAFNRRTLSDRELDCEDATLIFEGTTVEAEDPRRSYGEPRIACYGMLAGRLVVVGDTPRGAVRHVFSMRRRTIVRKPVSRRILKSDLGRVDAHAIRPHEYKELPEISSEALSRAVVKKGGGRG